MSFFENTRKPEGFGGKIMVAMMNVGHSAVARWGLRFLNAAPDARVLDCGCGGGANMKRLLKKMPAGCRQGHRLFVRQRGENKKKSTRPPSRRDVAPSCKAAWRI